MIHSPQVPPRATGWLAGLALVAALALPLPLVASEIGRVEAITEGEDGDFRGVDMSAGTVCMRGGVSTPLRPGFGLEDGDRLVSPHARVVITIGQDSRLLMAEGADLVLAQRRVEHAEGPVFYQVQAPYEVAAGKVIIAVEGTSFLVEGGDTVLVAVDKGQVRVTSKEEPVLLTGAEQVEAHQGHVPGGVRPMSMAMRREAWEKTWLKGAAPLRAGFYVGGGLVGGAGIDVRLWANLRLPAHLQGLLDLGVGIPISRGGVTTPAGLGVGYEVGPLVLGLEGIAAFDTYTNACGGSYSAIDLGGAGLVQVGVPISRRLSFEGALRAGYIGAPLIDLGLGLGMGF
ncbi:MAG: FecR domain-containing protein [Pseudomonadota bacterium]